MLMLAALAALAGTPVSAAAPSSALMSHAPWWETVTVTIASDGKTKACEYRTSLLPAARKACAVAGDAAGLAADTDAPKAEYTKLTFERRFRPAVGAVGEDRLPSGDQLLGRQVLALAINAKGAVAGCKIVASAGTMRPDYGCQEARGETFEADGAINAAARQGYLSILVYGHSEHVV